MSQTIYERRQLRERLAEYDRQLQAGRCDMRARLAANEAPEGLRDLRAGMYRAAANEEQSAMGMLAWALALAFLAALGGLLGYAGAEWWTGGDGLATALACLRETAR